MKKDKKTTLKFILIIAGALISGFIIGCLGSEKDITLQQTAENLLSGLVYSAPKLMYLSAVPISIALYNYAKGKTAANCVISGDKNKYDITDKLLEKAVVWTMYTTIYSFGVFGVMTSGFSGCFNMENFPAVVFAAVFFFAVLVAGAILQSMIMAEIKRLNPEKCMDIACINSAKEWCGSCDENEKSVIRTAGYKAYQRGIYAIMVIWALLVFAGMVLPVGPLPVLSVTVVWFIMYFTYAKTVCRVQVSGRREM